MSHSTSSGKREFDTTRWSLVGVAQSDEASRTRARMALGDLRLESEAAGKS